MKTYLTALLLALLVFVPAVAQNDANLTDSCVADYDPNMDYFPDKVEIDYAEGFSVEYFNNYKVVTILQPWQNAEQTFEYVLVQCGTPAPEGYDDADQVIEVPVQSIVTMSTTFLPSLVEQGVVDRLVAMDSFLYTNMPEVIEMAEAGEIAEVGGGGSGEANIELLVDLDPDIIMAQQFSPGDPGVGSMLEVGLPVVLNSDFVDTSPLGQAEWSKYIALYFNTEAEATDAFDDVATRYQELAAMIADIEDRPTVFAASPFNETWFMPGGNSTIAQLLDDAGADYLWSDSDQTGSLSLDFETVLDRAADTDFWVNLNQFWQTKEDALADDERYTEFAAFRNDNVYNNNAIMNENGGNAYFESGVTHPDRILADLVKIFHPDLLPDHELIYYQPLLSGDQ